MKTLLVLFLTIDSLANRGVLAFVRPEWRKHEASSFSSLLLAKRVRRIDTAEGLSSGSPSGPRSRTRRRKTTTIKRAPHQFDHTKEEARPFVDTLTEITNQIPNEDAPPFDLGGDKEITHPHIESYALDDLFPGLDFSKTFSASADFRTKLRNAVREDIFDTTLTYHGMSEKARKVLLLPDSSLQGSWKCRDGRWVRPDGTQELPRMQRLTNVLQDVLGEKAPTGDHFMDTIGSLCGPKPSTHWIDIVGVLNRRIPHSWHQDTGRSPENSRTVLLGFPPVDNYDCVGVFSHVVKLKNKVVAAEDHPADQPVVYKGLDVPEEHIVRPRFAEGRELILYRDIDVLHSSPDVAYRASVMRFM